MKQTAVEFLVAKLKSQGLLIGENLVAVREAKEIEKQQIIASYKMGRYDSDKIVMSETFYSEQYYNETFKNK